QSGAGADKRGAGYYPTERSAAVQAWIAHLPLGYYARAPILLSVPAIRRWMLEVCLMASRTVSTPARAAIEPLPVIQRSRGVATLAARADRDEYRVRIATVSQTIQKASAAGQCNPKRTPM